MRVTYVSCGTLLFLLFWVLTSSGLWPEDWWPHFGGFAKSADMQATSRVLSTKIDSLSTDINNKLVAMLATQRDSDANTLRTAMRDDLKTMCNITGNTQEDRDYRERLSDQVDKMEQKYYSLTGQGWQQPTCEQLGETP